MVGKALVYQTLASKIPHRLAPALWTGRLACLIMVQSVYD